MKKSKKINTQFKVVQSNTNLEEKKEDAQKEKNFLDFNKACTDFISVELKKIFENSKMETDVKLCTFIFHLTQEFVFDKLPMGTVTRAIYTGLQNANESYLAYLKDAYDIKTKEEALDTENRTVN